MADAVQALDEIGHLSTLQGEDIGADEIIVSDDEGREVGRIASVSGVGGPPLEGSSASWPVASEEGLPPNCELPGQAHLTVGNKMSLVDHPPRLSHFRLGAVSFRRARRVPETR